MPDHSQLVKRLCKEFKSKLNKSTTVDEACKAFEEVLTANQDSFQTKRVKRQPKNPDGPKKTNWQAVWTSNENGCRVYDGFKAELDRLMKEHPDEGRFKINKMIRDWANSNGTYAKWQQWARERLEKAGKTVPDEKSADTTTEVKQTTAKKETTKEVEVKAARPAGKRKAVA